MGGAGEGRHRGVVGVVQGGGGAFLMANSSAILTDAFPANQRGMALGVNMVAAVAGSFLGLLIGGVDLSNIKITLKKAVEADAATDETTEASE